MKNQLADDLERAIEEKYDGKPCVICGSNLCDHFIALKAGFRHGWAARRLRAMPTIAGEDAALVKRLRRWCFWKDHACKPGRADPNCAPCEAADRIEALTATPRPASLDCRCITEKHDPSVTHPVTGCSCERCTRTTILDPTTHLVEVIDGDRDEIGVQE
jgi:hypothetical protein